jgi:hypothetical protein
MRFTVAVLAGGIAQLVILLRADRWSGPAAAVALAYILFAAFGAGFFAGRHGWIAGLLTVATAMALYVAASSFAVAAPVSQARDALALSGWALRLAWTLLPYALAAALAGAAGGWVRARTLGVAR